MANEEQQEINKTKSESKGKDIVDEESAAATTVAAPTPIFSFGSSTESVPIPIFEIGSGTNPAVTTVREAEPRHWSQAFHPGNGSPVGSRSTSPAPPGLNAPTVNPVVQKKQPRRKRGKRGAKNSSGVSRPPPTGVGGKTTVPVVAAVPPTGRAPNRPTSSPVIGAPTRNNIPAVAPKNVKRLMYAIKQPNYFKKAFPDCEIENGPADHPHPICAMERYYSLEKLYEKISKYSDEVLEIGGNPDRTIAQKLGMRLYVNIPRTDDIAWDIRHKKMEDKPNTCFCEFDDRGCPNCCEKAAVVFVYSHYDFTPQQIADVLVARYSKARVYVMYRPYEGAEGSAAAGEVRWERTSMTRYRSFVTGNSQPYTGYLTNWLRDGSVPVTGDNGGQVGSLAVDQVLEIGETKTVELFYFTRVYPSPVARKYTLAEACSRRGLEGIVEFEGSDKLIPKQYKITTTTEDLFLFIAGDLFYVSTEEEFYKVPRELVEKARTYMMYRQRNNITLSSLVTYVRQIMGGDVKIYDSRVGRFLVYVAFLDFNDDKRLIKAIEDDSGSIELHNARLVREPSRVATGWAKARASIMFYKQTVLNSLGFTAILGGLVSLYCKNVKLSLILILSGVVVVGQQRSVVSHGAWYIHAGRAFNSFNRFYTKVKNRLASLSWYSNFECWDQYVVGKFEGLPIVEANLYFLDREIKEVGPAVIVDVCNQNRQLAPIEKGAFVSQALWPKCALGYGCVIVGPKVGIRTPVVPRCCCHNSYVAARNRVTQFQPEESEKEWDGVNEFVKDNITVIFDEDIQPVKPIPFESWIARFPEVQRPKLVKAKESLDSAVDTYSFLKTKLQTKSFVKREKLLKVDEIGLTLFDPRMIQGSTPEFQVATGPITVAIGDQLKRVWPAFKQGQLNNITYASGMNSFSIGQWYDACLLELGSNVGFFEDDCSRWDSTFRKRAQRCEMLAWEILKIAKKHIKNLNLDSVTFGVMPDGTSFKVKYRRKSGRGNTSSGNSVVNGIIHVYLASQSGWKLAGGFHCIVLGDDMLVITTFDLAVRMGNNVDIITQLGFSPKSHVYRSPFDAEFCSSRFWPSSNGTILGPKIGRVLSKTYSCLHRLRRDEHYVWLKGVCLGMKNDVNHIPVLRVVNAKLLDLLHGIESEPIVDKNQFHSPLESECVDDTWAMMDHLYCTTKDQILDLEQWLWNKIKRPTVIINHPLLDLIVARDVPNADTEGQLRRSEVASVLTHMTRGFGFIHVVLLAPFYEELFKRYDYRLMLLIVYGETLFLMLQAYEARDLALLVTALSRPMLHSVWTIMPFWLGFAFHSLHNLLCFAPKYCMIAYALVLATQVDSRLLSSHFQWQMNVIEEGCVRLYQWGRALVSWLG